MKIGSVVQIKPFEAGDIGGIYHCDDMKRYIGETFVVISKRIAGGVLGYRLSSLSFVWAEELLEPVKTNKEVVINRDCIFYNVYYDSVNEIWRTKEGDDPMGYGQILLAEKTTSQLPYDIYGVGKQGETVDVIQCRDRIYLDNKYLPMYGLIKEVDGYDSSW